MTVYNAFNSPFLGMNSQAHALDTIGINIANITTGGYKATETRFATVLSRTLGGQSDLGGVKPRDFQRIDQQGAITTSPSDLDVAIGGHGFFILNTTADGSGSTRYGRDGSFEMTTGGTTTALADDGSTITVSKGYLTDKNGYFVQGLSPDAAGNFSVNGTLSSLRVDQFAFQSVGQATTAAELRLNLPANDAPGTRRQQAIEVIDSTGTTQTTMLNFYKSFTNNRWVMVADRATAVAQIDTVTLAGTIEAGDRYVVTVNGVAASYTLTGAEASLDAVRDALVAAINADPNVNATVTAAAGGAGALTLTAVTAGTPFFAAVSTVNGGATDNNTASLANTTPTGTTFTFDGMGNITAPAAAVNLSLTWPAPGGTASVSLDVSGISQFAGDFIPFFYGKNGFASAGLSSFNFDSEGHIIGNFDNGTTRQIYKVPLAVFSNPNGLEMKNGNIFAPTEDAGTARTVEMGSGGVASLIVNARELSNVDMADEFTRMIMTQTAYNSSAQVFRTVDEMVSVARDLKR